jgi:hypothetical protein
MVKLKNSIGGLIEEEIKIGSQIGQKHIILKTKTKL